jgi:hypothetical protein
MKALSTLSMILAAIVGCNTVVDRSASAIADSGQSTNITMPTAMATQEAPVDAAVLPDAGGACTGRNPNCLVGGCESGFSCELAPSTCVDSTFVCNAGVWQPSKQDCGGRVCLAEAPSYFIRVGIVQGQAPVGDACVGYTDKAGMLHWESLGNGFVSTNLAALAGAEHLSLSRYIGLVKKPDLIAFADRSGSCSDTTSFLGPGMPVNAKSTTLVQMPKFTDARVVWMLADSATADGIRVVNAALESKPFRADLLYLGGVRKSLGQVTFGKANTQGYVRERIGLSELQIVGDGGRNLRLPLADRTGTFTVYVNGYLAGAKPTALVCNDSDVQPTGAGGLYSNCAQVPFTDP